MVIAMVQKVALSGIFALIAGASLVNTAAAPPPPAYGPAALRFEADAAANDAARLFDRADLNNDDAVDTEEYAVLTLVTVELARLNGFISVSTADGVRTVGLPAVRQPTLSGEAKGILEDRALREFAVMAGDDERLLRDEFVTARLEQFLASDHDRNGVLTGGELNTLAASIAHLPRTNA